jgi:hypothetical protein
MPRNVREIAFYFPISCLHMALSLVPPALPFVAYPLWSSGALGYFPTGFLLLVEPHPRLTSHVIMSILCAEITAPVPWAVPRPTLRGTWSPRDLLSLHSSVFACLWMGTTLESRPLKLQPRGHPQRMRCPVRQDRPSITSHFIILLRIHITLMPHGPSRYTLTIGR